MLTTDKIKRTLTSLGYKWFEDRPNIVGIRTSLDVPDVFNDILFVEWKEKGHSECRMWPITTDPGVYYQKKLLNAKGCAVMCPGQYENCYAIGFHQNKTDHRALIQVGQITVLRDKDMNGIAGDSGTKDTGFFGVNIHGAQKAGITKTIGPWSAGCIVFQIWSNKEELINICEKFKEQTGNKFTYTLISENQLA